MEIQAAVCKADSCMTTSTFGFVGSEHEAVLQQVSGGLRQGTEVLDLQGVRRPVDRSETQKMNVMLGMWPTRDCCFVKDPRLCEEPEGDRKEVV